ncbi:zwei Ig domain protein zig-8-like [Tachypleus tridentatus]|uniref:zwei Ig domain protein zig-8-like n=1 Tax=Tachypleus tridentatus TaxID=6853 RepID=UPI003FD0755C
MFYKESRPTAVTNAKARPRALCITNVGKIAGVFLCLFALNKYVVGAPDPLEDELFQQDFNWQLRRKRMMSPSNNSNYWLLVQSTSPSFDPSPSKNITTQIGQTVYLHCMVNNLGDKTVSWIRRRDLHLLSVGTETYINDERFSAAHVEGTNDWPLQIKYPQLTDTGLYECQVSSDPKISFFVKLNVLEPKAEILGTRPLYVKTGTSINLTCVISDSPEPPVFVFWYHNDRMINYDRDRGKISLQKGEDDAAISTLYIRDAQPTDSGNYTCGPSNSDATSISVFFLNGENPAAIQRDASASRASSGDHLKFFLLVFPWYLVR